jgi:hypothetical protein
MATNKTIYTSEDVQAILANIPSTQQQADSQVLIQMMEDATGEKAKMFGPSIIGFGKYYYKYDSGHEGEAPLIGFSPRKAAISLYVYSVCQNQNHLLEQLGKYKMGKACIYVKKLTDINLDVLKEMMQTSIEFISEKYQRI